MQVDTEQQVSVIEKSIEIFKAGPAILKANQERSQKALIVGQAIVDQWHAAWNLENKEKRAEALAAADARSNKYLSNCTTALKEEKEQRAVITQLMTEFAKMYTAAENEIDKSKPNTIPGKVQNWRDTYAEELAKEEKRRIKEAEEEAERAKARIEHKARSSSSIAECLNNYLAKKKTKWTCTFNEITLQDIGEKSTGLANLNCSFPLTKLNEIIVYTIKANYPFSVEALRKIESEAFSEFNFTGFYSQYEKELTELKRSLIDRLPSKKSELEQIAKAAEEERVRQEAILKARGEAKKKLEEEQRLAAIRLQEQQEATRKREAEEAERLQNEAEEKQKQSQLELDLKTQADTTMVMFEKEAAITMDQPKPETRTGYEIIVQHPVGFTQIFAFYFEKEGKTLAIAELGKKTLDQMKAFCEKFALKTDEKIESKFLLYKETYKAINKKQNA